mgnify:CR=1 FL=1
MAKSLFSETIPKKIYKHTKWGFPREPLKMREDNQEVNYSDTIVMDQGGSLYVEYHKEQNCKHEDYG